MPFLPSFLAGLSILTTLTHAQKDNAARCECFRTNGSTHYYANHIFRDFRNVGGSAGDAPAIISEANASSSALATSDYFLSDEWSDLWATQTWNNSDTMAQNSASVLMVNSPNNVYIGSYLCPSKPPLNPSQDQNQN